MDIKLLHKNLSGEYINYYSIVKKYFLKIGFLFFFISLFSKAQISKPNTFFSFPIKLSYTSLEKSGNYFLPNIIFEDTDFKDNKNDNLKVKITKNGNLVFSKASNTQMKTELPLSVSIEKRLEVLGIEHIQKLDFDLSVNFHTEFSIDKMGDLEPKTSNQGVTFTKKPVIKILGITFNLEQYIIDFLEKNEGEYIELLDQKLKEEIGLSKLLLSLQNTISEPLQISKEYNTWVRVKPNKIQYIPIIFTDIGFETQILVKADLETHYSKTSLKPHVLKSLPEINVINKLEDTTQIESSITFPDAAISAIANDFFKGKTYAFKNNQYHLKIEDITIEQSKDKIGIILTTSEDFQGKIIISGTPLYNREKDLIVLENTKMKLETSNILYKIALWLKQKKVQKEIENQFGIPIQNIRKEIIKNIDESINQEISKGIILKGKTHAFNLGIIFFKENQIVIPYQLNAKVDLIISDIIPH